MERSNHRARNLPTHELVEELVVRLVDAMQTSDLAPLDSRRARTVLNELRRRTDAPAPLDDACSCAQCLGDLYVGEVGSDPF